MNTAELLKEGQQHLDAMQKRIDRIESVLHLRAKTTGLGLLPLRASVCEAFDVDVTAFCGTSKPERYVAARRVFCYIAHKTGKDQRQIADAIRLDMNRSLVSYHISHVASLMSVDKTYAQLVRDTARLAGVNIGENNEQP